MAASLRAATKGARRHISQLPQPANPPVAAAADSYPESAPSCRRPLPHASTRELASLAAEGAPGLDAKVAAPGTAGGGEVSERRSGLRALSSLFAPLSNPSTIRKYAGKDGRVASAGSMSRSKMRPAKSADSGSSIGSGPSGRAREVSPETASLVGRLQEEGYLKNASFLQEVDTRRGVANGYARGVLTTAAQRFGEDHQEIAKWLSGSSLKKVALSGCPCTERKTVFAAKRLRSFFCIQEDIVCRGCAMKNSCKFVNQRVNREEKLILADVMRVLTAYAWDSGGTNDHKLQKELNCSVVKSLKEVISLTA